MNTDNSIELESKRILSPAEARMLEQAPTMLALLHRIHMDSMVQRGRLDKQLRVEVADLLVHIMGGKS